MSPDAVSLGSRAAAAFARVAQSAADHLPAMLTAALVMLATWIAGRLVYGATRRVLAKRSTAGHVDVLVARFSRGVVFAIGIVVALGVLGVDLAALAASLGLVGLTLGLALRDVLANSISGVMLLIQRPFRIGDTIAVAGIEGVVEDVRVRDTVVAQPDGRLAFIPNTTVFNDVVINATGRTPRRFEIAVFAPAGSDLVAAREAVLAAVAATAGVLAEPVPDAVVSAVGPTSARIVAHGWVDTAEHGLESVRTPAIMAAHAAVSPRSDDPSSE